MNPGFGRFVQDCQSRVNDQLAVFFAPHNSDPSTASTNPSQPQDPYLYSMSSGGKRIRPILMYAAAMSVGYRQIGILDYPAAALELIHTYSLIHDDLPAMDDDDLRRGIPSLHKAYDEATAILVGDGLQAKAFELLADAPGLGAEHRIKMVRVLASAAGPQGMVGGQTIDIAAVDTRMNLEQLRVMHGLKTGALIGAALAMGGIAANASEEQMSSLGAYGKFVGVAFQVVDDILDVEGVTEKLGKTQGKDVAANKPNYVELMGLEGAKNEAKKLLGCSLAAIEDFGESADHLRDLAKYIVERDH